MNNDLQDSIRIPLLVNKSMVYEYFRHLKNKDITRLLNLFADDATIHDIGLKGKSTIKPFLEVAMMATKGMRHEIEFEKSRKAKRT